MPRIHPLDPNQAEGKAKTLLDGARASLGMVPNVYATMANSPAVLEAYVSFQVPLDLIKDPSKPRLAHGSSVLHRPLHAAEDHRSLVRRRSGVIHDALAPSLGQDLSDPIDHLIDQRAHLFTHCGGDDIELRLDRTGRTDAITATHDPKDHAEVSVELRPGIARFAPRVRQGLADVLSIALGDGVARRADNPGEVAGRR